MSGRAMLLKLQPNQDVTIALELAARNAGFSRARIIAAVGSLAEGVLNCAGAIRLVEGPAIEVAALSGEIDPEGGSLLHGYLCSTNTQVVAGELVRGLNGVGVTFEVLLAEYERR